MGTPADVKARATATYTAAADRYDVPANAFWARFGRRTVERLGLSPGARVLDVCCGSGASAIPAAEMGLEHAEFRTGDLLDLQLPPESFDAVVCVFGIFFVRDMPAAVRALGRVVRPGGQLAITTWGPRFFEPASSASGLTGVEANVVYAVAPKAGAGS